MSDKTNKAALRNQWEPGDVPEPAQPVKQLCEDEGCPHHGTPHVCINTAKPAQPMSAACKPGEYLSVDGRCLHDQTGEGHPAADNCNSCSCMDAACHQEACTAMACLRGDDPAPIQPEPAQTGPERVTADERKEGATK